MPACLGANMFLFSIPKTIIMLNLVSENTRTGCDQCTGEECEWLDAHNEFRGMVDPPANNMQHMVSWRISANHVYHCLLTSQKYTICIASQNPMFWFFYLPFIIFLKNHLLGSKGMDILMAICCMYFTKCLELVPNV